LGAIPIDIWRLSGLTASQGVNCWRQLNGSLPRSSKHFLRSATAELQHQLAVDRLGLRKRPVAVANCRKIGKADMVHNSATPHIEADVVRIHQPPLMK